MDYYFFMADYTADDKKTSYSRTVKANTREQAKAKGLSYLYEIPGVCNISNVTALMHHPVDTDVSLKTSDHVDERIFTSTHMADFAQQIAEEAVKAVNLGIIYIDGQPLADYIEDQLDAWEGQ